MNPPRPAVDPPAVLPPASAQRLDWLFRHSLRRGQIHPMWAVMQRYRQGELT